VTKLQTVIPIPKTASFLLHGAILLPHQEEKKWTPAAHAPTMHAIAEA